MVQPWSTRINAGEFTALLVGPGLAARDLPDELRQFTRHLWQDSPVPMIADASALDWLPPRSAPGNAIRVMTPHPGETTRLLKTPSAHIQSNRVHALRELSQRFGNCWVILKGHQTLVGRSTGDVFVNSSGNPGLAQGGSGDALAGYLAGLLAQPALQGDVLKAMRYAVWQHGAAADLLQTAKPNWVIEDLVETLGLSS
jgi:NAD(P)H-hydrate epimerase